MVTSVGVIRAGIRLMRVIPVPLARGIAMAAGTVAWYADGRRRRALLENLSYTARDRSLAARRRIGRRTFRKMASCVVDQFRLPTITLPELRDLFEERGIEHVRDALAGGKGVIVVSGHIGPYELAAGAVAAEGYAVHTIIENLAPEVLDALASYRAATGLGLVNMKDSLREAYRILGRNEILLLAADRAIGEARSAIEVPFAGGRRRLPTGPAVFAQATGAPIIVGFVYRNPGPGRRYVIEFHAPVHAEGRGEEERNRLTRRIADEIGAFIMAHPDEWFVFHPHWITRDA